MNTARISALLAPFLAPEDVLSAVQLDQISTYIDLLLHWNARVNLTAVRDPESVVTRHFGESLFLARHVFPAVAEPLTKSASHPEANRIAASAVAHHAPAAERRKSTAQGASPGSAAEKESPAPSGAKERNYAGTRVVDVGSGAGFPGLPLKIWAPHISLTLIESNHKKSAFLREVSRALTLTDVNVIAERAETLSLPPADLVTLRAVERFENVVPIATRFLAPSGRLALLIGAAQFPALVRLTPQLSWQSSIPIPFSESRVAAISHPRT